MLSVLPHTQTDAVWGRACVCIEEADILYFTFLRGNSRDVLLLSVLVIERVHR